MKVLTYKIEGYTSLYNSETEEVEQRLSLANVIVENPTEDQITMAAEIAYGGKYEISDDGEPEPVAEPTDAERIAELEEALALLLSGVVK